MWEVGSAGRVSSQAQGRAVHSRLPARPLFNTLPKQPLLPKPPSPLRPLPPALLLHPGYPHLFQSATHSLCISVLLGAYPLPPSCFPSSSLLCCPPPPPALLLPPCPHLFQSGHPLLVHICAACEVTQVSRLERHLQGRQEGKEGHECCPHAANQVTQVSRLEHLHKRSLSGGQEGREGHACCPHAVGEVTQVSRLQGHLQGGVEV